MRTRNWFGKLGLTVSVLLTVAALCGLAAPYLAGSWIEFDIFSHFRLHFISVGLFALVAGMMPRMWPVVLLAGAIATPVAIGVLPSVSEKSAETARAANGEVPIKVLTYNTWNRNGDWPALETFLRREDADVVVLMEFGPSKRPLLQKMKALYPFQTDCVKIGYCHLALLSKEPFVKSGYKTNWKGPPIIWARFGDKLGGLTVIGTHLTRPPFASVQYRQIRELAARAKAAKGPAVVAGDFNATPWSRMLTSFEAASGLGRLTGAPTWPTFFFGLPQLGIDHIFVSEGIRTLSQPTRGRDVGSDHLPISVKLAVPVR